MADNHAFNTLSQEEENSTPHIVSKNQAQYMRDKFQISKSKRDSNDYSHMNIESEEHGRESA